MKIFYTIFFQEVEDFAEATIKALASTAYGKRIIEREARNLSHVMQLEKMN